MPQVISSSLPLKSRIRFSFDLTEGTNFSIFNHTLAGDEQRELKAFGYQVSGVAKAGGFGNNTTATRRHTNITTAFKTPNGSDLFVRAVVLQFDQTIWKPLASTSIDTLLDDSKGKQQATNDLFTGQVFSHLIRVIAACYRPYFVVGDTSYDLGGIQLLGSDGRGIRDGRIGLLDGPKMAIPEGIRIPGSGENSTFSVNFKLERDMTNHSWNPTGSAAAEVPGTTLRSTIGYPAAAAAPAAAGVVYCNLDADVYLFGQTDTLKTT